VRCSCRWSTSVAACGGARRLRHGAARAGTSAAASPSGSAAHVFFSFLICVFVFCFSDFLVFSVLFFVLHDPSYGWDPLRTGHGMRAETQDESYRAHGRIGRPPSWAWPKFRSPRVGVPLQGPLPPNLRDSASSHTGPVATRVTCTTQMADALSANTDKVLSCIRRISVIDVLSQRCRQLAACTLRGHVSRAQMAPVRLDLAPLLDLSTGNRCVDSQLWNKAPCGVVIVAFRRPGCACFSPLAFWVCTRTPASDAPYFSLKQSLLPRSSGAMASSLLAVGYRVRHSQASRGQKCTHATDRPSYSGTKVIAQPWQCLASMRWASNL
jgi:hypothetical protein